MMRGPEAKKERANYVYAEEELEEWVRKIREIEGHVDEVHLVMNTIQAMANAGLMAKLLGQELTEGSSIQSNSRCQMLHRVSRDATVGERVELWEGWHPWFRRSMASS